MDRKVTYHERVCIRSNMRLETEHSSSRKVTTFLRLDVLGKFTNNIACWSIFAHIVLGGRTIRVGSKNGLTGTAEDCTTDLLSSLPNYLSPVRVLGVIGIILGSFTVPALDSLGCAIVSSASCQVFTVLAVTMLEHAAICPRLCYLSKVIRPCQGRSAVISPLIVMGIKVGLDISTRCRRRRIAIG